MKAFTCYDLTVADPINFGVNEHNGNGYLYIGLPQDAGIRIEASVEEICRLHDKIGQLVNHMLRDPYRGVSQGNPLKLADESVNISEEIKPF